MDVERTQGTPSNPEEEALKVLLDPEKETLEAPSDPDEEIQEAPLYPEETKAASSNPDVETNHVPGLAAGSTDLERPAVPARRTFTVSGNIPPNNVITHVESTGARRRERNTATKFCADEREKRRE